VLPEMWSLYIRRVVAIAGFMNGNSQKLRCIAIGWIFFVVYGSTWRLLSYLETLFVQTSLWNSVDEPVICPSSIDEHGMLGTEGLHCPSDSF
jgi:hypothetical protein